MLDGPKGVMIFKLGMCYVTLYFRYKILNHALIRKFTEVLTIKKHEWGKSAPAWNQNRQAIINEGIISSNPDLCQMKHPQYFPNPLLGFVNWSKIISGYYKVYKKYHYNHTFKMSCIQGRSQFNRAPGLTDYGTSWTPPRNNGANYLLPNYRNTY